MNLNIAMLDALERCDLAERFTSPNRPRIAGGETYKTLSVAGLITAGPSYRLTSTGRKAMQEAHAAGMRANRDYVSDPKKV